VDLEKRVRTKHPLRLVREVVNEVLSALDGDFAKAYADSGRPSIAPERLLRALLLQAFYSIRSERQLMEQLDSNLLYRWFVGLGVDDDPVRAFLYALARRAGVDEGRDCEIASNNDPFQSWHISLICNYNLRYRRGRAWT